MTISPAQVRCAFAGSGCLEPGATRFGRTLSRLSLESRVQCARGVARLSRGVSIPAGPGLALQRAACVPYHASSQCPRSPPSRVRTPGSPAEQRRCGGPTAFILRAWGWVFLGSAVGWCSVGGKGWGSGIGAEEPAESSCPCYFGGSARSCHFRSHSCTENIVADTQQDDLLAVIHGEASQAGCRFCFVFFF